MSNLFEKISSNNVKYEFEFNFEKLIMNIPGIESVKIVLIKSNIPLL